MENASKALLMAAEILIGVLILSIGMYLYITFSATASQIEKENTQIEIDEYNAQYTSYASKEYLTIYDVVTLANLAKENNKYYGYTQLSNKTNYNYYIQVKLGNTNIEWNDKEEMDALIKQDLDKINGSADVLPRYTCEVNINPNTLRVDSVIFAP